MKTCTPLCALVCGLMLAITASANAQGIGPALSAVCQPPDSKLITSSAEVQLKEQLSNLCEGCTDLRVKARLIKPKDPARFDIAAPELVPLSALDLTVTPATDATPADVILVLDPSVTLGSVCEAALKLAVKISYRSAGKKTSKTVTQDMVVLGTPKFKKPTVPASR